MLQVHTACGYMHACMICNVGLAVWLLEVCFCHFAFVVSQCGCLNLKSAQCTDPYFYVIGSHFTNFIIITVFHWHNPLLISIMSMDLWNIPTTNVNFNTTFHSCQVRYIFLLHRKYSNGFTEQPHLYIHGKFHRQTHSAGWRKGHASHLPAAAKWTNTQSHTVFG